MIKAESFEDALEECERERIKLQLQPYKDRVRYLDKIIAKHQRTIFQLMEDNNYLTKLSLWLIVANLITLTVLIAILTQI